MRSSSSLGLTCGLPLILLQCSFGIISLYSGRTASTFAVFAQTIPAFSLSLVASQNEPCRIQAVLITSVQIITATAMLGLIIQVIFLFGGESVFIGQPLTFFSSFHTAMAEPSCFLLRVLYPPAKTVGGHCGTSPMFNRGSMLMLISWNSSNSS